MHYVLIDYENVQPDIEHLVDDFNVDVTVFLGAKQRIKRQTRDAVWLMDTRAEIIKMTTCGPNALDFHLAFHLGQLIMGDPVGTFEVISNDKGYDSIIQRLNDRGINVQRTPGLPRDGAWLSRGKAAHASVHEGKAFAQQVSPATEVDPQARAHNSQRSGHKQAPTQAAALVAQRKGSEAVLKASGEAPQAAFGAGKRVSQGLRAEKIVARGQSRGAGATTSGPKGEKGEVGILDIAVSAADIVVELEIDPAGLEARHWRQGPVHQSGSMSGATTKGQPPRRAGLAAPTADACDHPAHHRQSAQGHNPNLSSTIGRQASPHPRGCQEGGAPLAAPQAPAAQNHPAHHGHNLSRIRALRKSLHNLQRKIDKLSAQAPSDSSARRKLDRARQRQRKLNHLLSCAQAAASTTKHGPNGRRILRVPTHRR